MLHIKNFMNKVSVVESKQSKDLVIPINDARGLRDEIAKLLADLHELHNNKSSNDGEIINIDIKGGSFK